MWVRNPVTGASEEARERLDTAKGGRMQQAANRARPGRILVVEDNVDSRDLLSKLLGMSGYEVSSAPDGESGYAAALKQLPDLIITDINMPRMDGIALLKRVRLEGLLTDTSVLVVTAFGSEAVREAVEAGADAATAKPFDFDAFVDMVKSLIFTRRRKRADG